MQSSNNRKRSNKTIRKRIHIPKQNLTEQKYSRNGSKKMKTLNNKKQEKQPCEVCIHWSKIYTRLPIVIGEKDAGYPLQLEELVLLHCKIGQTQISEER